MWREVAIVCKHFNLDSEYVYEEIPPNHWFACLSVALDREELEDYKAYVFGGGDPKKFPWASTDHAGTAESETGNVMEQVLRGADRLGLPKAKRDIWEYGEAIGLPTVVKVGKWQEAEGDKPAKFLGYVWVNENGEEVDVSGYQVVETKHEGAKAIREKVYERLR